MQLKNFQTDTSLEEAGIWIKYPVALGGDGIEFKIASNGSPKFTALLRDRLGSLPRKKRENPKFADPIIGDCMAEAILLDWRGGEIKDGDKVLPNTLETRKMLMAGRPLREWVSGESTAYQNYQQADAEAEDTELEKP